MSTPQLDPPSAQDRVSSGPCLQQESKIVPFPLGANRQLIARLADRFLAIPPSDDRANIWRRKELGQLERKRRAQGIAPEIVQRELRKVEQAVAERLAAIFEEDGGAA